LVEEGAEGGEGWEEEGVRRRRARVCGLCIYQHCCLFLFSQSKTAESNIKVGSEGIGSRWRGEEIYTFHYPRSHPGDMSLNTLTPQTIHH
jgi:hypothetical protein